LEVALLFLLIPVFGLTGAALATGFAFVSVSVFRMVLTRRLLGIRMLDAGQAKIVFLWAGCLAAALLLPVMLGRGSTITMAISVLVFLAMYVVFSIRLPTGHGASYRPQCS